MIHDTKQGYYMLLMHNVCYDFLRDGMNIYVKDPNDVDISTIPGGTFDPFFHLNPSLFNWLEFPSPRGAVSELPQDHRKPEQLHADSAQFPQHCPLHGGLHDRLPHPTPAPPIPARIPPHRLACRSTTSSTPRWRTRRFISGSSTTRTSRSPSSPPRTDSTTSSASA